MAYIYVIENTINNKKYVGKTNFSIQKRFKEHLRDSKKNRKEKRPLYNAINKYGEENFSIRVLEEVSVELSAEREKYWINFFDSFNNGYNATIGGDGKTYLDYNKILSLFDNTLLSQREIAHQCNCSIDSVKNIVSQYREDIDWNKRLASRHIENSLGLKGLKVRCIETGIEFDSCTQAANWLIKEGKIKSQAYGRNNIPKVCRKKKKTLGSYHWEFV